VSNIKVIINGDPSKLPEYVQNAIAMLAQSGADIEGAKDTERDDCTNPMCPIHGEQNQGSNKVVVGRLLPGEQFELRSIETHRQDAVMYSAKAEHKSLLHRAAHMGFVISVSERMSIPVDVPIVIRSDGAIVMSQEEAVRLKLEIEVTEPPKETPGDN
jgi:hypothetical protein